MAIRNGHNFINDVFDLTGDSTANYGLEDDRVAGWAGSDVIYTGIGNDILDGGTGNDSLYDGNGNDTVSAGAGDDNVYVDAGNDIYYGGSGRDTLIFSFIHLDSSGSEAVLFGIKFDLALTSAQNLGEFGVDQFFGFENVNGSFGNDTFFGTDGQNRLHGIDGNDILYGRGGNDSLNGYYGADTLVGGLGADIIEAGHKDGSRDIIRYESLKDSGMTASTYDRILGFKPGQDKIDLSKLDANLKLKGNQAFKVVKGFTKALGEVKLVKSGADTIVQIDGDRDTAVDMTIRVLGAHLAKGDFIL